MRKYTSLFALILLTVATLSPLAANAQTPPANPPAGGSFDQRLAQRKVERAITLDEKTQKRLTATCVAAQGKLRILQQNTNTAVANRTKVYQLIDAKLWVMIGKLKIAEQDTFELEKQRAALAAKIATFQETTKNYQQTIDDLLVVNCQADPIGFQSLLETARLYRTQVRTQTDGIKTHINDTIKPLLTSMATELQAKTSTEGN